GLTHHLANLPKLRPFTEEYARELIAHVTPIQKKLKREIGTPFAYLGDEIYIMAGAKIPSASHYADFSQMENGVGMVRTFLTQFSAALRKKPAGQARGTVCAGTVLCPYFRACVHRLGMYLKTVAGESNFWGHGIG